MLNDILRVSVRFRVSFHYAEHVAFVVQDLVIFLVQELIQAQIRDPVHSLSAGPKMTLLCILDSKNSFAQNAKFLF